MFDFFQKKEKRRQLYERARGEFFSENYSLADLLLTQLINEGYNSYDAYNLKAKIMLQTNNTADAFKYYRLSTEKEPNISINSEGYIGRNAIVESLKSGEIKCDLITLCKYFSIDNVIQLLKDQCIEGSNIFINHLTDRGRNNLEVRLESIGMEFCLMKVSSLKKDLITQEAIEFKRIILANYQSFLYENISSLDSHFRDISFCIGKQNENLSSPYLGPFSVEIIQVLAKPENSFVSEELRNLYKTYYKDPDYYGIGKECENIRELLFKESNNNLTYYHFSDEELTQESIDEITKMGKLIYEYIKLLDSIYHSPMHIY